MTALIAREEQLTKLSLYLQQAMTGQLQIIFLTGEAGTGKTVLINTLVEQAKREISELVVAGSKCYSVAGGQQEPYLPFVQILETVAGGQQGNTIWKKLRKVITNLAPDWISAAPGGGVVAAVIKTAQYGQQEIAPQGQEGDTNRRLVQYANVLRKVSEIAPLLLWIDDLHWSDNATIDMLSFVADHLIDTRIMLIGAYRPTDIAYEVDGHPHPVKQLVGKLQRYQQCRKIEVPAFTQTHLVQFLETSKHRFPTTFVERLWKASGGNPLFSREYVNLLHDRQLVKQEQDVFVLLQLDIEMDIPETVQAVIHQRLDIIGQELRRLLSFASVQGERFASRVLAQLLENKELEVLEKLNLLDRIHKLIRELEKQQLIVKVGTEYQFTHALIQQTLYNDLSAGQRQQLHLAIAQLLEGLYGEDATRYAADIGIHFEWGGDYAKAIQYYLQAGYNALSVMALDDVLTHAKAIIRLAKQAVDQKIAIEWQIKGLLQIVEANYWKGEYEAVFASCDDGQNLCKQGDFVTQHAYFLYWRGMALSEMGDKDAIKPVQQALELLGEPPINRQLQGYLYECLGGLHYFLTPTEAQQILNKAINIAEENNLPELKVRSTIQKAWIASRTGIAGNAKNLSQEALKDAQNYNMPYAQVMSHRLLARAYLRLGEGDKALLHAQEAVNLAKQSGIPLALHIALFHLAVVWREIKEDWQKSQKIAQEAIAVAEKYRFLAAHLSFRVWFDITFGLGLWKEANAINKHFYVYVESKSAHPLVWGFIYEQKGLIAYAHGNFDETINFYQRAVDVFNKHNPNYVDANRVKIQLGLAWIEKGSLSQGVEILKKTCSYWQETDALEFAYCLQGLARADMGEGNFVQAIKRLHDAIEIAEKSYNMMFAWPTRAGIYLDLGKALLAKVKLFEASEHTLTAYVKLKKWGHFLLGETAFVVGQILVAQEKTKQALPYLKEAHDEWQRLKLTHQLSEFNAYLQDHGLDIDSTIE